MTSVLVSKTVCVNSRETGEIYMGGEGAPWPCKSEKEHEIKEERSKGVSMY